jgi:hypothetical protein
VEQPTILPNLILLAIRDNINLVYSRYAERFIQRSIQINTGIEMRKNVMSKMFAMVSSPPPTSKRSRKTLIAVIVIILIVALAVGVYLATRGTSTNPSTTPTPTPSSGATPTPTATSSGTGANVAGASSLQFTETITNSSGAVQGTYTYSAKNIGTSNMMIRIEISNVPSSDNMVFIVNGALQQAWLETGGQWTDMSSAFTSNWNSWKSTFVGVQNNLTSWTGAGDYTYADPQGDSVRISNISVNPSLADSLFQHS